MTIRFCALISIFNIMGNKTLEYLNASLSRRLASNSLLGGNFGKLEGAQGKGFVVKNWQISNMNSNMVSRISKTILFE